MTTLKQYQFYYDETEHSQKITQSTLLADLKPGGNYYDNFITGIIGFDKSKVSEIQKLFDKFEGKYAFRKNVQGELKSTTIKNKNLIHGFSSLPKNEIEFINDFLDIFAINNDIYIQFNIASKLYLVIYDLAIKGNVKEIFKHIGLPKNSISNFTEATFSSFITNSVLMYAHDLQFKGNVYNTESFIKGLIQIMFARQSESKYNPDNSEAAERELGKLSVYTSVLNQLNVDSEFKSTHFDLDNNCKYDFSFKGFTEILSITNQYKVDKFILDQEGTGNTINAAKCQGFSMAIEKDSLDLEDGFGLRITDFALGLFVKLLKAAYFDLRSRQSFIINSDKMFSDSWKNLTPQQFYLYKKFYINLIKPSAIYLSGEEFYETEFNVLIAWLEVLNTYESFEDFTKSDNFNVLVSLRSKKIVT